jgi:hypothetical protein
MASALKKIALAFLREAIDQRRCLDAALSHTPDWVGPT